MADNSESLDLPDAVAGFLETEGVAVRGRRLDDTPRNRRTQSLRRSQRLSRHDSHQPLDGASGESPEICT